MAAAVVAHRAADVIRHGIQVADEGFDRLGFERRMAGEGFVHIHHVSVVMFAVMDFHRHSVDVRLERAFGVREMREFVSHNFLFRSIVVC